MGIIHRIIDDLGKMPFFEGAKYSKNTMRFMWKTEWGHRAVIIGIADYATQITVDIFFEIKYNILLKWFRKYDDMPDVTRRTCSVSFDVYGLNKMDKFKSHPLQVHLIFKADEVDYEEQFNTLYADIVRGATYVFETYGTLTKLYNQLIIPLLNRETDAIDREPGVRRVLQYLTLCMIVSPDKYPLLKKIIFEVIEDKRSKRDPVVEYYAPYYDRFGDILADFETNFAPKILKDKSKLPL